jgi:GDP-4-dehydro-6-deoxy-D-mannose reductase
VGNAIVAACNFRKLPVVGIVRERLPSVSGETRRVDLSQDVTGMIAAIRELHATVLIHCAFSERPMFETDPERAASEAEAIDRTVIAACRSGQLQRVVLVSSSAIYGLQRKGERWLSESRDPAPSANYGRAKLAQEKRFQDGVTDTSLIIAREFNVTGPGEPTTNVAGALAARLAKLSSGDRLPLRSSESVRDFSDIRDAAGAILRIATAEETLPRIVNVCSGVGTRVADYARMIVAASGKGVTLEPDRLGADSVSVGDPSVLTSTTGWQNKFTLTESAAAVWKTAAEAFAET